MSDVVNDRAHRRYELTVDGHLAATHRAWSPVCNLGFTCLND